MAPRITVEPTRPSLVGAGVWSGIAGPWEIDYSYAAMRALELHPFNDATGPRTMWWVVREEGRPVGMYTGYVTETYNFATLFTFGPLRWSALIWDALYRFLNERGWYGRLERWNLALLLRINAGRSRAMFLITPTADVGGHVIGQALRDQPPQTYLPPLLAAVEDRAKALAVEQVTFREAAEGDAGPARYPNLWRARDERGRPILHSAGYSRNPGFPPAFVDLREVQACRPFDGNAVYAFYRHGSTAEFVAYESARQAWLADDGGRAPGLGHDVGIEDLLRHPSLLARTDSTRLHRFRTHLFRSGILPDALVETARLDRAERILKSAPRTVRRLGRLRAVQAELSRRIAGVAGSLPPDLAADLPALLRARSMAQEGRVPHAAAAAVARLAAAVEDEARIVATMDPRFASLPSARRSTLSRLASGRIRDADRERARLRRDLGDDVDQLVAIAATEGERGLAVRRLRAEISDLQRATGVQPDQAPQLARAQAILAEHAGRLPEAVVPVVDSIAPLRARLVDVEDRLRSAEVRLEREAVVLRGLLLGEASAEVRPDLQRTMAAAFRKEQDRIATQAGGGVRPRSARERRQRLDAALAHRPLDYSRMLRGVESLRDSDRGRIVREHEAHQAAVRAATPHQPGPVPPAFDADGYLASGLQFIPRDERVWTNLSDQDRITSLYHRTMANSLIRHDVEDWPYRVAYREAGSQTGDQLHISTLRAGGPEGPIVAAVSLKRSPAGHFRPERIAKPGNDFGAYYSLVLLVMANEVASGGTLCSLGQTAQGTKLRDFGATFVDVHQYTRFRGLIPRLLGFDLVRRAAFRRVRLDRILEFAAMPPEERREAARRHGFRWRF